MLQRGAGDDHRSSVAVGLPKLPAISGRYLYPPDKAGAERHICYVSIGRPSSILVVVYLMARAVRQKAQSSGRQPGPRKNKLTGGEGMASGEFGEPGSSLRRRTRGRNQTTDWS